MEENNNMEHTAGAGSQEARMFTQDDVNRIVQERLTRVKIETSEAERYKKALDATKKELEELKKESFLKERKVREEEKDYVAYRIGKLMEADGTDFQTAGEKFLKENPRYISSGYRVVSSLTGFGQAKDRYANPGADDPEIRKAMGLK